MHARCSDTAGNGANGAAQKSTLRDRLRLFGECLSNPSFSRIVQWSGTSSPCLDQVAAILLRALLALFLCLMITGYIVGSDAELTGTALSTAHLGSCFNTTGTGPTAAFTSETTTSASALLQTTTGAVSRTTHGAPIMKCPCINN